MILRYDSAFSYLCKVDGLTRSPLSRQLNMQRRISIKLNYVDRNDGYKTSPPSLSTGISLDGLYYRVFNRQWSLGFSFRSSFNEDIASGEGSRVIKLTVALLDKFRDYADETIPYDSTLLGSYRRSETARIF